MGSVILDKTWQKPSMNNGSRKTHYVDKLPKVKPTKNVKTHYVNKLQQWDTLPLTIKCFA